MCIVRQVHPWHTPEYHRRRRRTRTPLKRHHRPPTTATACRALPPHNCGGATLIFEPSTAINGHLPPDLCDTTVTQ